MVTNIHTLNPTSYIHGNSTQGKLLVPVSPNMVIYSQLKHVSGFSTKTSGNGVNINKIQILNTLLDRLVSMKQKVPEAQIESSLSEKQVDALIKDYETQITKTILTAQSNPYALQGGVAPPTGMLFTIGA